MQTNFVTVMQNHIGKANAISGADLAHALGTNPRQLRHMTDALIDEGIALCSHPANGYWIAQTPAELETCCQFHNKRGLHELGKEAKLRKMSMQDLLGQLHLKT